MNRKFYESDNKIACNRKHRIKNSQQLILQKKRVLPNREQLFLKLLFSRVILESLNNATFPNASYKADSIDIIFLSFCFNLNSILRFFFFFTLISDAFEK